MNSDNLVNYLMRVGWKDFSPGDFLDVHFEHIGRTRLAHNNWFVLIKSIPVLDATELDHWNGIYTHFCRRARAGFFTAGKFFVLILLVGSIALDAMQKMYADQKLAFLEMPADITRGGGYTLLFLQDRKRIFMPRVVSFSPLLQATDFARRTHQALETFRDGLA